MSNLGRVRGLDRWCWVNKPGHRPYKKFHKGMIQRGAVDKNGYRVLRLAREGNHQNLILSRVVALAWIPNPDGKPEVNHISAIKSDNSVKNLEWATQVEQRRHCIAMGIANLSCGSRHYSTRLTDAMVGDIRFRHSSGISCVDIAKMYPETTLSAIYGIVSCRTWKHLP